MGFVASSSVPDADYLLERAVSEAKAAQQARDCRAAEAHHRLASSYLDLVFSRHGSDVIAIARRQASHRKERQEALKIPFQMLGPISNGASFTDLMIRLP